jgi:hypothetical protein
MSWKRDTVLQVSYGLLRFPSESLFILVLRRENGVRMTAKWRIPWLRWLGRFGIKRTQWEDSGSKKFRGDDNRAANAKR